VSNTFASDFSRCGYVVLSEPFLLSIVGVGVGVGVGVVVSTRLLVLTMETYLLPFLE
jgi:hypothetical protein